MADNGTTMTPAQREQLLAMQAAGSDNWSDQARTYCHLMFARELVRTGRIGERPTEQLIRRACRIPSERGGGER